MPECFHWVDQLLLPWMDSSRSPQRPRSSCLYRPPRLQTKSNMRKKSHIIHYDTLISPDRHASVFLAFCCKDSALRRQDCTKDACFTRAPTIYCVLGLSALAKQFTMDLYGTGPSIRPSRRCERRCRVQWLPLQPSPRRVVTPQAQHPLQSDGAGPVLLTGDCPHRSKPNRERFTGALKNCPRGDRALVLANRALPQQRAHRPSFPLATPRALKAIRPPQPDQIFLGGLCFTLT